MQFDRTRIAVRERSFPDILDLALILLRKQLVWLLPALLAGAIPAVLVQYFLLRELLMDAELSLAFENAFEQFEAQPWDYLFVTTWLSIWIMPLVTAPLTLVLGQTLFFDRPAPRQVVRDYFKMLPQLIWYQAFVRGLVLLVPIVGLPWWFCRSPYISEIILLERNPWRKSKGHPVSTHRRNSDLRAISTGDLFSRWLSVSLVGTALVIAIWCTLYYLRGMLVADIKPDWTTYAVDFPIALWMTLGFFTIVRFLSYLDLRIRDEGWEIELSMRAEAARLTRQFT